MLTPFPAIAKVIRDGNTVTLRTKLPEVNPASVRARIIDGELIVTANTDTGATHAKTSPERHRLIDLGPKLRPTVDGHPC